MYRVLIFCLVQITFTQVIGNPINGYGVPVNNIAASNFAANELAANNFATNGIIANNLAGSNFVGANNYGIHNIENALPVNEIRATANAGNAAVNGMNSLSFAGLPISGVPPVAFGDVAVAGELPVGGSTAVNGNVPVIGFVTFEGHVPAGGTVTLASNCGYNNPTILV